MTPGACRALAAGLLGLAAACSSPTTYGERWASVSADDPESTWTYVYGRIQRDTMQQSVRIARAQDPDPIPQARRQAGDARARGMPLADLLPLGQVRVFRIPFGAQSVSDSRISDAIARGRTVPYSSLPARHLRAPVSVIVEFRDGRRGRILLFQDALDRGSFIAPGGTEDRFRVSR